jgi:hypothetical protein
MATTSLRARPELRSPGRFMATAERLVALWRQRADFRDARLRDLVVRAHIDAEAYRLHTFQTVASLEAGEPIGPESSINKLFWSEMDVAALDRVGWRGRTRDDRLARRTRG